MQKLSDGSDSTLGTYLKISVIFGEKATSFIQEKIDNSPNGKDEVVIAAESQMMMLLGSMLK